MADTDKSIVLCSACQAEIGHYESGPDQRVWLRLADCGLLVRDVNAVHNCGAAYHYHTSDKQLDDLVQRALDNKCK